MKCGIYDYETLGQDVATLPVVSLATLEFDTDRFVDQPYSYSELLQAAKYYKFDVADQVKNYGKKIEKDTMAWWQEQDKAVLDAQLAPKPDDMPIDVIHTALASFLDKDAIYTRRNTFDPMITVQIMKDIGKPMPYAWWSIRDSLSTIEGMSWGSGLKNNFIPEGLEDKAKKHDPIHDIALDVMRMQTIVQAIS